jgi:membrane protein DedA with SNARE-associated domain
LGGALINYYLARMMARPLLVKFGKYFFISAKTIAKTETFFRNHGEISTFTGRLLPGIRQLISIPAGAFGMPMSKFLFFTGLGSGIWLTFLVFFGYFLGENQATIKEYAIYIKIIGILLAFACIAIYFFYKRRNS